MIDPHSDKTYWSNCNFPEDFRDYWQLTKAFMPGGNTKIDDPFKVDPVALLTVMNKCRLFDVETELIDKIISKRNGFVHIGSEKASITTEQTDEFFELIIRFLTSLNGWFDCEENKARIEKIKESEVTAEMFTKANAKHVQSLLNTLSDHTAAGNDISKIVSDVECTIKDKVKVEIVETYGKDPELQNDLTLKLAKQELVNYDQERMINAQNITIDNLRIEKSNKEQEKSDLEMKLETREHTIVTQEGTIRQLRTDYQSNSMLFNYLVIICIAASIFLAMLLY